MAASISRTDQTAWKKIRKQIIERDKGHCLKCGRGQAIEVHHIVPVREDGTDEPENLATLCHVCHLEWDVFESGMVTPFDEWLTIPPLVMLVSLYRAMGYEKNAQLTAKRMRRDIDKAHEMMLHGLGSDYAFNR